jgi:D-alanyl-D-alanine-carboxypeptidase/D-alanyl-D-alanine-endopeptidase
MIQVLIVAVAGVLGSMLAFPTRAQHAPEATGRAWTIPGDEEIRRLLVERLDGRSVGVVVGVLEPTGTRIVTFGRSGAADGRALDGETVFQIGSVTKVFTGLLLADMTVRGLVQLEDPAAKYLPVGVRMPQRGRPITLIDLSKHWSGLPSMPTNFSLRGRPDPYAAYTEQDLHRFLDEHMPAREPGTQEYSNLGVALLGRLLARRSGLEYETLLRQRVIDPLGLRHTAITVDAEMRKRLSPGHDRFLQPVDTWNLLALPASGSLRSTANDLLRFVRFNLSDESPLRDAMLLQRAPGRALGWGRSTIGGDAVFGHEGGKEGYRSAVVFNPRTRTGVVILMNTRADESPMAIARHLLFGGHPLAPPGAIPSRPVRAIVDPAALGECEGRYRLDSGGLVEVARRGDHLLVQVAGEGVATYFPSTRELFWGNTDDADIRFGRDPAGRISTLTLRSGSSERVADRIR